MKAATALAILLSVLSLTFSQPSLYRRFFVLSRLFAGLVALIALLVLLEYFSQHAFSLDALLVAKAWLPQPGTTSPQSALCFALLSVVLFFIGARKRTAAQTVDLLLFLLCLLLLVIGSGHLFGANHLDGPSPTIRVGPQTFICFILLAYVAILRRGEYGVFAILMGVGIGSKIARIACPFALLLPFMLDIVEDVVIHRGWVSPPYATAIVASLAAMLGFALIIILAWRINTLEKTVRDLSLRDDLTQLYNRRGFYVLAEQALRLAQRSQVPFSVLFIDLDDLKQINDALGHDAGSHLLAEVAALLRKCFRKSDVIGRVGGDEFVVAGESNADTIGLAVRRLELATNAWNARPGRPFLMSFSYGHVTSDVEKHETLEDLLGKADRAMYKTKRQKKLLRDSDPNRPVAT